MRLIRAVSEWIKSVIGKITGLKDPHPAEAAKLSEALCKISFTTADVNAKNDNVQRPLDLAVSYDSQEVADLLRQHAKKSGKS